MSRERRWIILVEDGRHVTVGRHTDPTEDEIVRASEQLTGLGFGGWLVVMEGVYYAKADVSLMMVRELAKPTRPWDAAVDDFKAMRVRTTVPGPAR